MEVNFLWFDLLIFCKSWNESIISYFFYHICMDEIKDAVFIYEHFVLCDWFLDELRFLLAIIFNRNYI